MAAIPDWKKWWKEGAVAVWADSDLAQRLQEQLAIELDEGQGPLLEEEELLSLEAEVAMLLKVGLNRSMIERAGHDG